MKGWSSLGIVHAILNFAFILVSLCLHCSGRFHPLITQLTRAPTSFCLTFFCLMVKEYIVIKIASAGQSSQGFLSSDVLETAGKALRS